MNLLYFVYMFSVLYAYKLPLLYLNQIRFVVMKYLLVLLPNIFVSQVPLVTESSARYCCEAKITYYSVKLIIYWVN